MRPLRLALAALLLGGAAPAVAQVPGSELTVSVITVGPGAEVWERWGHDMIRIRDARTGLDLVYNYGMFDFRERGFLLHFLEGRLNYWTAAFYTAPTVAFYRQAHRSMWEQTLRLTPVEKAALRDFLDWNGLPANRFYRYDYYRDNCATRVRDAIDRVLGGAIARATRGVPTGTTDRDHTRRLTQDDPFLRTGLMLLLGPATDRPLDEWDEMFLPVRMMYSLRHVRVDSAGVSLPLVQAEDTLYQSDRYPEPTDRGPRIPLFLLVGVLIGGGLVAAALVRRGDRPGWWWLAATGAVAVVTGLAGVVAVGLWSLTDHVATYGNQNVLQVNLAALALAFTLRPLRQGRAWAARVAPGLALFIATASLLGLGWHLVRGGQANGDVLALLVPTDLGLAASVWLAIPRPSSRTPSRP